MSPSVFPWLTPQYPSQYGPLPPGFRATVPAGYASLVGPNNVGKSAILQAIFRDALHDSNLGFERVCYIPSDRFVLAPTTEVGGRSLDTFNREIEPSINNGPLNYENFAGPGRSELFRLLINHADFMGQSQRVTELLARLDLPPMTIRQAQQIHFNMIRAGAQGSGIRNILPIVAALTDSDLALILIDEPETSLEPSLQRSLRDLLVSEATEDRPILVATHSHLFLDRGRPESVIRVTTDPSTGLRLEAASSASDLLDVTFRLLGNSTQDLYFPGNFLVTEGASDQRVAERILELLGARPGIVKVLSAGGIDRAMPLIDAVRRTLVPLTTNDSPYSRRAVVLLDDPQRQGAIDEFREALGDRLYVLPAPSLEEFIDPELYQRAAMDKQTVLEEVRIAKTYSERSAIKRRASASIASVLTEDDLSALGPITDAARAAIALAQ
jgi:hypothetical protein